LTLVLAACSPPPVTTDAETDAADAASDVLVADATDAGDPHDGARMPRCEDMESTGDPMIAPVASTLLGTIEPMGSIVGSPDLGNNPVYERAELLYRGRGLDQYTRGPAQARLRRADLGDVTPPATTPHSLAYFVHLSDTQLVDDESPSRLALIESPDASGGIRPQEPWLAHAISAMNRTLGALQRTARPFQFGIFAGDCADSAQSNELQWFAALMNGQQVELDSGDDNDPLPGPGNDPKDPLQPVGFPAPWYFVPGNHDVEVVGVAAVSAATRATALGNYSSTGTRDYTRWWAEPHRGSVVVDPRREQLDRSTIVSTLQGGPATPGPVGHGFTAGQDVSMGANYVVDVVPNLLRIIAVDTSDHTGGSPGLVERALIDTWLRPQLDRARTDGVLVMLASHHPTSDIDTSAGEVGDVVPTAVPGSEIETLVAGYPGVIAWLVGHDHQVRVRAIRGADAAHPGYWEIQSGSIADFPSQARVVELVDNGNGTLSILGTMIDYEPQTCMERRFRRLSIMDMLSGWAPDNRGVARDRNVELVIPMPPGAAARVAALSATAATRIESETTLRGMR
ncbi:MAG: hypothetical protein WCJ30_21195, partial [Deltaproteobacteria bacterium]